MLGDGLLCLTGQLFRLSVGQADDAGTVVVDGIVDDTLNHLPSEGHILAGSTWRFQSVYRDPQGPCATGFNATNVLAVTFVP